MVFLWLAVLVFSLLDLSKADQILFLSIGYVFLVLVSGHFWFITKGPLLSVVLAIITDALGFVPTFRKSYHKPNEETTVAYFLGGLKYIFALAALDTFSVVTALFPIYL